MDSTKIFCVVDKILIKVNKTVQPKDLVQSRKQVSFGEQKFSLPNQSTFLSQANSLQNDFFQPAKMFFWTFITFTRIDLWN